MQSHSGDALPKVKREEDGYTDSKAPRILGKTPLQDPVETVPLDVAQDPSDSANVSNQLVVYNPGVSDTSQATPDSTVYHTRALNSYPVPDSSNRVLPSVGAFTVQCAACYKWRLIPTKEKYEAIRESILSDPFVCEKVREWRPGVSCDDPADISQDNSRLWAIDKPNISQPPPGWQRLLRIRSEGSTRFADVYYVAPCGKKLRSMVEIQRYLLEHPAYMEAGVNMSQFSYQIPKPLQEGYVRKRPYRAAHSNDAGLGLPRPLEPTVVNPLAWAGPDGCPQLEMGGSPVMPTGYLENQVFQSPAKKRATEQSHRQMCSPVYNHPKIKVEGTPHQSKGQRGD